VLPKGAVAREIAEGKLIARQIVQPDLKRTLSLVRGAESSTTPEFTRLCRMIDETLRQIGSENAHFAPFGAAGAKPTKIASEGRPRRRRSTRGKVER
jgi:hypothetical protein